MTEPRQNPIAQNASRALAASRAFSFQRFILQWEWMLVLFFVAVNLFNIARSPNYLVWNNLMNNLQGLFDKAIMVFPMMLVILLGEIDISVASTMALSAVLMGVLYQAGVPFVAAICIGLLCATLCGFINGLLLARFPELSSMIITLSTQIIYRGIASIMLEDTAVSGFPSWFQYLGWGYVGPVPFILVVFGVLALGFGYLIHFTRFGRNVYAMGNNETAAKFSGVQTGRYKIIIYTIMGLFAGIAALFLASKLSSVRPSIAKGYELDVIAMVVLGGVSNAGGKGRVIGVVIATFIISLLRYGLGLTNVPAQTILVIIGTLLIVAVAIPNLKESFGHLFQRRRRSAS